MSERGGSRIDPTAPRCLACGGETFARRSCPSVGAHYRCCRGCGGSVVCEMRRGRLVAVRMTAGAPTQTRNECGFHGCDGPPRVIRLSGRWAAYRFCDAHAKQLQRGGPLRPYKARTDLAARWARFRKRRAIGAARLAKKLAGLPCGECGGPTNARATNHNGIEGLCYRWCRGCRTNYWYMHDLFIGRSYRGLGLHAMARGEGL